MYEIGMKGITSKEAGSKIQDIVLETLAKVVTEKFAADAVMASVNAVSLISIDRCNVWIYLLD